VRELPDGTKETTIEDAPRTIGGTAQASPRETMKGSGVGVSGGRTEDDASDSFFKRPAVLPGAWAGAAPAPKAPAMTYPNLAPTGRAF
jgi:hypothetical protein